jgi:hypothetical protein
MFHGKIEGPGFRGWRPEKRKKRESGRSEVPFE